MEALTNDIEEKKEILLSRSGGDGAPCAIARLVLAQAQISNQQKPKHKNLLQKMAFHLLFESNGIFYLFQAQRQSIPQCRLLVFNCFLTRGCFKKRYGDIAEKRISGVIHGIRCVSYVMM